jgi:hypothetical protein
MLHEMPHNIFLANHLDLQRKYKFYCKQHHTKIEIPSENYKHKPPSKISQLHKEYKTLNSTNLNQKFTENPQLWHEYHKKASEN